MNDGETINEPVAYKELAENILLEQNEPDKQDDEMTGKDNAEQKAPDTDEPQQDNSEPVVPEGNPSIEGPGIGEPSIGDPSIEEPGIDEPDVKEPEADNDAPTEGENNTDDVVDEPNDGDADENTPEGGEPNDTETVPGDTEVSDGEPVIGDSAQTPDNSDARSEEEATGGDAENESEPELEPEPESEADGGADSTDSIDSADDTDSTDGDVHELESAVDAATDYVEYTFGPEDDPSGAYYVNSRNQRIVLWINFVGGKVYREDCDFDKDGSITTRDLIYAGMNMSKTTVIFDNQPSSTYGTKGANKNVVKLQAI